MLGDRIMATIIFMPIFIAMVLWGGIPFAFFIDAIVIIGILEFYQMLAVKGLRPFKILGVCAGTAIPFFAYFGGMFLTGCLLSVTVILFFVQQIFARNMRAAGHPEEEFIVNSSVTVMGVLYVSWLFSHIVLLRELPRGMYFVFSIFLLTWGGDAAAYIVGSIFGRHKICPKISPHKSVEGCAGGIIGSVAAAFLVSKYLIPELQLGHIILMGLLVGVSAILGDLGESLIKRETFVKDSGSIIPGHGGVLDRFDSLLFTIPVMYYYVKIFL